MIIVRTGGSGVAMKYVECFTGRWRKSVRFSPGNEPLDGGSDRRRWPAVLHDCHWYGCHLSDGHVVCTERLLHKLAPRIDERPEGRKPRLPIGKLPERRRRLPEPLPKGPGEGIRSVVTSIHRYFRDALIVTIGQSERSTLHPRKLYVAMHRQPKSGCELPVEVELREGRDSAYCFQVQLSIEIPINMIKRPLHSGIVVLKCCRHCPLHRGDTIYARRRGGRSTNLAVRRIVARYTGAAIGSWSVGLEYPQSVVWRRSSD